MPNGSRGRSRAGDVAGTIANCAPPRNEIRARRHLQLRRLGKFREQRREPGGKLLQIAKLQATHGPLQRTDGASGSHPQYLLTFGGGMDLNAALIAFVAASLDPTALDEAFQDVTDGWSLHAQPDRQM
jgi:hypothetical protein